MITEHGDIVDGLQDVTVVKTGDPGIALTTGSSRWARIPPSYRLLLKGGPSRRWRSRCSRRLAFQSLTLRHNSPSNATAWRGLKGGDSREDPRRGSDDHSGRPGSDPDGEEEDQRRRTRHVIVRDPMPVADAPRAEETPRPVTNRRRRPRARRPTSPIAPRPGSLHRGRCPFLGPARKALDSGRRSGLARDCH
jgi:hypothetical protein